MSQVTVVQQPRPSVNVTKPVAKVVEVSAPGPQGPPVEQLSFSFPVAALRWVIHHNLGRHPVVVTVDLAEVQTYGDVSYIDANTVYVDFVAPRAGMAYVT